MAKLSERVTIIADWNAGYREDTDGVENVRLDLDNAAAVCAAVEAFQAAEQVVAAEKAKVKPYAYDGIPTWCVGDPLWQAEEKLIAAKVRLLEVNLG